MEGEERPSASRRSESVSVSVLETLVRPTKKGYVYKCPYCGRRKYLLSDRIVDFPLLGFCGGKLFFINMKEVK